MEVSRTNVSKLGFLRFWEKRKHPNSIGWKKKKSENLYGSKTAEIEKISPEAEMRDPNG